MRLVIHKPFQEGKGSVFDRDKDTDKQKWRVVSFRKSSSSSSSSSKPLKPLEIPKEFLCPISASLMSDPVIVSSGHTFDRSSVQACNTLGFVPTIIDGTVPDFSSLIPNLALKSAIVNWCNQHSLDPPKPLDFFSAEKLVRAKMEKDLIFRAEEKPMVAKFTRCLTHFSSSSVDSVESRTELTPPSQLTRPSCFSSTSSSSEIEILSNTEEDEEIITKLKSPQVFEIEEALISIRKTTKTKEESRILLCTPRLLSALRTLITSRYSSIQLNSVACLVNLSLEKANKVKIVRSGIVPLLIDVLKGGFAEAQEHACGAIFSLALEDHNKTAIGVLGALPPLLHLLRSESEWTRHDSAFALYHLSLVQSNRTRLVKLGAAAILLGMVKSGHMRSRVLLILTNLASCLDGRAAILDSGGVDCLVGMLREGELESESTRESCISVLYELSHGGLRFKGLANATGAEEVLLPMQEAGRERTREKAIRILEMVRGKGEEEEEEDVNWEEVFSGSAIETR